MNKTLKQLCSLAIGAAASVTSLSVLADDTGKSSTGTRFHGGDEVMMQGFHWNSMRDVPNGWYNVLEAKAAEIASLGVTIVWMPPPWKDESSWAGDGKSGGGEGYFWHSFDLNTKYGTAQDLQDAIDALHANGVKVAFDIVANHRNRGYGTSWMGNNYGFPGGNWRYGGADDGDPFMSGDSDLNTANTEVYNDIKGAMQTLVNMGADGFRWDFVRGFSASRVDAWMSQTIDNGFCVGELWKAPNEYTDYHQNMAWKDILNEWSGNAGCGIFDFALKNEIQNGDIYWFRNALNADSNTAKRERAITFVDNHDTGYSPGQYGGQHHWARPDWIKEYAYAYILTTPGTPSIYWPDVMDWGMYDFVQALVGVRQDAGIKAYSNISFVANTSGVAAYVDGTNKQIAISIGSDWTGPGGSWQLAASGSWGKVWVEPTATLPPVNPEPPVSQPEDGVQRTVVLIKYQSQSGEDMFIRGGIDHGYSDANRGTNCASNPTECTIPHSIKNDINYGTTHEWKQGDERLDWGGREANQGSGAEGSALEWTTNNTGNPYSYAVDGFGYFDLNTYGDHYWLYEVDMNCSDTVDGWFELKAYVKNGAGWEGNISQTGTPYASNNHFAKCGKINVMEFGQSWINVLDF